MKNNKNALELYKYSVDGYCNFVKGKDVGGDGEIRNLRVTTHNKFKFKETEFVLPDFADNANTSKNDKKYLPSEK